MEERVHISIVLAKNTCVCELKQVHLRKRVCIRKLRFTVLATEFLSGTDFFVPLHFSR
jgi:hypothetical protein